MDERDPASADKTRRCPICGKTELPEHRPFCSARCRMIDLGRWLKGDYRVPTDEAPPDASVSKSEE